MTAALPLTPLHQTRPCVWALLEKESDLAPIAWLAPSRMTRPRFLPSAWLRIEASTFWERDDPCGLNCQLDRRRWRDKLEGSPGPSVLLLQLRSEREDFIGRHPIPCDETDTKHPFERGHSLRSGEKSEAKTREDWVSSQWEPKPALKFGLWWSPGHSFRGPATPTLLPLCPFLLQIWSWTNFFEQRKWSELDPRGDSK